MQKGFTLPLVLVTILLLSLIGAGGYYFYQTNTKESPSIPTPQASFQPQIKDETENEAKPLSSGNWKIYTNSDYGISFSYPKELFLIEEKNSGQFIIRVKSDSEEVSLVIEGEDMGNNPFGMNPTKKVVLNEREWEYFPSTNYCDAGECGNTLPIYQAFNGHYRIHLLTQDPERSTLFKQILNSFEWRPDPFYEIN